MANRSHPVVGAASTASADSFFMFSSPDLVGWSARDNEATGNPFRRGDVPVTAASIPGVAAENGGLAMNDPKERNPQQSQQERDQQQRERQQREQQQRQNQQPNQKPGQPGQKPGQPQHRDE